MNACMRNILDRFRRCLCNSSDDSDDVTTHHNAANVHENTFADFSVSEFDDDEIFDNIEGKNDEVYVALYDFSALQNGDLSFSQGDKFKLISDQVVDGWLKVSKLCSDRPELEGYVPKTYIAKIDSPDTYSCYHGAISRSDVNRLLLSSSNLNGAFLMRKSRKGNDQYVLSVRETSSNPQLKHYRVELSSEGEYHLTESNNKFRTLSTFVQHYQSEEQSELPIRLTSTCSKDEKPQTYGLSRDLASKWELDEKFLSFGGIFGRGQFGKVYRGKWKDTFEVAVKALKTEEMDRADFLNEAEVMKQLHHPKLVMLYGVCTKSQPFYIVTEFMRHGSLKDFLTIGEGKQLNTFALINLGAQVAEGMSYLESRKFVHRDLAARNVLVGENRNCKIADFGLARLTQDNKYLPRNSDTSIKLPVKWTAPEAYFKEIYTIKSDVWSFGILLTEIISKGERPFRDKDGEELQQELRAGYRMPKAEECPNELHVIMTDCWKREPEERPSFEELQGRLEEFEEMDDLEEDSSNSYPYDT
ncbi:tyrosine-protein kinase FRK-like [Clavelina lepadiformis]|uniref:tyrosine-protein kinase FRK-like n=1 Tax=Clavelina lepadiformis TaxID=159417 RepID=UPI004042C652